jgi:hypothetical protein
MYYALITTSSITCGRYGHDFGMCCNLVVGAHNQESYISHHCKFQILKCHTCEIFHFHHFKNTGLSSTFVDLIWV